MKLQSIFSGRYGIEVKGADAVCHGSAYDFGSVSEDCDLRTGDCRSRRIENVSSDGLRDSAVIFRRTGFDSRLGPLRSKERRHHDHEDGEQDQ